MDPVIENILLQQLAAADGVIAGIDGQIASLDEQLMAAHASRLAALQKRTAIENALGGRPEVVNIALPEE